MFYFSAFCLSRKHVNTEKDVSAIFCHALVIRSLWKILLNHTCVVSSLRSSDIWRQATENTVLLVLEILIWDGIKIGLWACFVRGPVRATTQPRARVEEDFTQLHVICALTFLSSVDNNIVPPTLPKWKQSIRIVSGDLYTTETWESSAQVYSRLVSEWK